MAERQTLRRAAMPRVSFRPDRSLTADVTEAVVCASRPTLLSSQPPRQDWPLHERDIDPGELRCLFLQAYTTPLARLTLSNFVAAAD